MVPSLPRMSRESGYLTPPLRPSPPNAYRCLGVGLWAGHWRRGESRVALAQWEPGGGDLLPALASAWVLLAVPSASRVPLVSPELSDPRPPAARPAGVPFFLFLDLSAVPSGLDIMGDGGEGEDEVQFLRTVRISLGGLWGDFSGSSEFSVLIAGGL